MADQEHAPLLSDKEDRRRDVAVASQLAIRSAKGIADGVFSGTRIVVKLTSYGCIIMGAVAGTGIAAVAGGGFVPCMFSGFGVAACIKAAFIATDFGLSCAQSSTSRSLGATDATVQMYVDIADQGAVQLILGRNGADVMDKVIKIVRDEFGHCATSPGAVPIGAAMLGYIALQQCAVPSREAAVAAHRVRTGYEGGATGEDWAWLAELLRLSTAVYGRLAASLGSRSGIGSKLRLLQPDRTHATEYAGLSHRDIVASNWDQTDVFAPAYMVVVDRGRAIVFVVLRGTSSATDALTDLHCTPCDVTGHHSGMREAATRLSAALLPPVRQALAALGGDGRTGRLVLTGHSLGAGVATLLAWAWQGTFPDLHCFAFAPPATMNMEESLQCRRYVTSVVLGDDVVASWSLGTTKHFVDGCASLLDKSACRRSVSAAVSGLAADVAWCRAHHARLVAARDPRAVLFAAGKVLWLPRTASAEEDVVLTSPAAFSEVVFSGSMFSDHLFGAYEATIDRLVLATATAMSSSR